MNLQLLKNELDKSEFAGLSAADALALLNASAIEYFVSVPTADVHNALVATGIYAKLLNAYHNNPNTQIRIIAETAIDAVMGQIPELDLGANSAITQGMSALVSAGVLTAEDGAAVTALAKRTRSRAEELLGELVTEANINAARNLDNIAALSVLEERLNTAHGDALGFVQQARTSLEVGEIVEVPTSGAVLARFTATFAEGN